MKLQSHVQQFMKETFEVFGFKNLKMENKYFYFSSTFGLTARVCITIFSTF